MLAAAENNAPSAEVACFTRLCVALSNDDPEQAITSLDACNQFEHFDWLYISSTSKIELTLLEKLYIVTTQYGNADFTEMTQINKFEFAVFLTCAQLGFAQAVKRLLAGGKFNPVMLDNHAMRWASKNGHIDVVVLLLSNDDRAADPSARDNEAVRDAAENGHAQVVKLLLTDERVDPSEKAILRSASVNGCAEVVEVLLTDSRVEVSLEVLRKVDAHPYAISINDAYVRVISALLGARRPSFWPSVIGNDVLCVEGGLMRSELDRFEAQSWFLMLLSVKRRFTVRIAARVGDVLREVCDEWTRFSSTSAPK